MGKARTRKKCGKILKLLEEVQNLMHLDAGHHKRLLPLVGNRGGRNQDGEALEASVALIHKKMLLTFGTSRTWGQLAGRGQSGCRDERGA